MLSVFDGIGTGILAVTQLIGEPRLAVAWETDQAAAGITSFHMPFVRHRGDFLQESLDDLCHLIHRHDPHQQCRILMLGAPPCPDFSSINHSAESFQGQEGSKFDKYISFCDQLETKLSDWVFIHLCENVMMQTHAEVHHVSHGLRAEPIVVDAGDLGIISRPRLWWTRRKWSASDLHPISGTPLRWGSFQKIPKLYMDLPLVEAEHLDLDGYSLPGVVARHEKRLPCLTTPAPTADGRPPPKKLKGKIDPACRARWMGDGRRFAPWHYHENAMLSYDQELIVPWASHKDQLHGFDKDYTAVNNTSEHDRHRLLGNSWHLHVAKFIILLLLQSCQAHNPGIPEPPSESALQMVCRMARSEPPSLGTCQPFRSSAHHRQVDGLWDHWRVSADCCHPILAPPSVEAGILQTMEKCLAFSDIPRLRQEILQEVEHMVWDWEDFTNEWLSSRRPHIQQVYRQSDNQTPTQVPVFLHILEQTGFPCMDHVIDDMTNGFVLTSEQHPGPGWPVRTDERYSHPISEDQFKQVNQTYLFNKLRKGAVDPHWQAMLQEILVECTRGRMVGPFESPPHWPVQTVALEDKPLLPAPADHIYASVCFSVEQNDKIRKCEDFKRSGHNSMMVAFDSPIHHGVDHYVQLCRWQSLQNHRPLLWAHDLDAAYRQLPIRDVEKTWTIICTPSGPMLFQHQALPFGAAGSVWAFNRFADLVQWVARKVLLIPLYHYVDDFGSAEPAPLAESGFTKFSQVFGALGLLMKEKKALRPSTSQKLLGVIFNLHSEFLVLEPCPTRMTRMTTTIKDILRTNNLRPEVAQKLCGKLVFLQTTSFGQVGRALLQPIYARAHSHGVSASDNLNGPLRITLTTLLRLLETMPSRRIPLRPEDNTTSIYTDAFFQLGDQQVKPDEEHVPRSWNPSSTKWIQNGWGFTARLESRTLAAHGVVPPSVLQPYSRRRAFIYVLELMAPIIAIVSLHRCMSPYILLWIDNRAGLAAMAKGYGRDEAVNNMLSFFWCFLAKVGIYLHCEWVPSAHNLADGISRHSLEEVTQGRWTLLDLPLKFFHSILQRCATDTHFASTEAVHLALEWSTSFKWHDLVLNGEEELEMGDTDL